MKKMSTFGLLALLVLGFASVAQAADIKATGKWQIDAYWNNSMDFSPATQDKTFRIEQRMRTKFEFIANENLKGVLDTQIGSNSWGNGLYGVSAGRTPSNGTAVGDPGLGVNSAGSGNIMLRQGYIDFNWPGTKINTKAGFQTVSLPVAFGGGSFIFDDQVGAVVVSSKLTDNVSILGGYMRPYDANNFGSAATITQTGTSADAVFAAVPVNVSGMSIVPFGAFMYAGSNAAGAGSGATSQIGFDSAGTPNGTGVRGYWAGVAFTMTTFEPFKLMADLNYGKATYDNYSLSDPSKGGRSGFLFDIALDYTGLSMMTPEVYYVYSSGEKGADRDTSNRMPIIGNPQSWSINNSFFFGDRNMISGYATNTNGSSYNGSSRNVAGFWATGVALKDIKLIDNFSHTVHLMYAKGTNDSDFLSTAAGRATVGTNYGAFLTNKDSMFEIDLSTKYNIFKELSLVLDLGYVNANFDKDTWRQELNAYNYSEQVTDNAYRVALGLTYAF